MTVRRDEARALAEMMVGWLIAAMVALGALAVLVAGAVDAYLSARLGARRLTVLARQIHTLIKHDLEAHHGRR